MKEDVNKRLLRQKAEACLSDFALYRLRLGDLAGTAKHDEHDVHLQGCLRCRERMDGLAAVRVPVIDFAHLTEPQRNFPPRVRRRRLFFSVGGLVAAAAAAMFLLTWHDPAVRSKGGGWQLLPVVQYPNGRVARISQGAAVAPGDRMRFEVAAPADAFVSVLSLDARGTVTAFVPAQGRAVPVKPGRRLLEGAVVLDDALGPERLVLLACTEAVAVEQVVAVARSELDKVMGNAAGVGTLPLPCRETSFWFRKERRP